MIGYKVFFYLIASGRCEIHVDFRVWLRERFSEGARYIGNNEAFCGWQCVNSITAGPVRPSLACLENILVNYVKRQDPRG